MRDQLPECPDCGRKLRDSIWGRGIPLTILTPCRAMLNSLSIQRTRLYSVFPSDDLGTCRTYMVYGMRCKYPVLSFIYLVDSNHQPERLTGQLIGSFLNEPPFVRFLSNIDLCANLFQRLLRLLLLVSVCIYGTVAQHKILCASSRFEQYTCTFIIVIIRAIAPNAVRGPSQISSCNSHSTLCSRVLQLACSQILVLAAYAGRAPSVIAHVRNSISDNPRLNDYAFTIFVEPNFAPAQSHGDPSTATMMTLKFVREHA